VTYAEPIRNSIPRPEVVKRIRPDNRSATSTPKPEDASMAETAVALPSGPNNQPKPSETKMPPSKPARPEASPLRPSTASPHVAIIETDNATAKTSIQSSDARPPVKEARLRSPQQTNTTHLLPSKEPPQSPRSLRSADDTHSRPVPQQQDMPPPSAPSSTPSAQELRTTAKVLSQRGDERSENKGSRSGDIHPLSRPPSRPPSRGPARGPTPPPSRRRSLSPVPRGPPFDNRVERPGEVDRSDRSSGRVFPPRQDRIQRPGMDADRVDRSPRDRAVSSSRELDRIRDPDRDRDRERDRERERERDRDRHRRDWEKDKGRDSSVSRKDRETPVGREPPSHPRRDSLSEDLPTGPDLSRNRSFPGGIVEDHLGKRRRGPDEDVRTSRALSLTMC
jgi:THO complex subunit 2